jgi:hypothetical protein
MQFVLACYNAHCYRPAVKVLSLFTFFALSIIQSLVVASYATGCKINYAFCPHNVFVCAARLSEQTAVTSFAALIEFNELKQIINKFDTI